MSNPHRGEVETDILGESYTLKLNTNAIAEMQQAMPGLVVGRDHPMQFGFPGARVMFYGSLLHDRKRRLTLEQAGDKLDEVLHSDSTGEAYNRLTESLAKALRLFFDPNSTDGEAPKN